MTARRARLAGLLIAMTAVGMAGCSSQDSSSSGGAPARAVAPALPGDAAAESDNSATSGSGAKAAAPTASGADQPKTDPVSQPGVDRKLVRTATVELSADSVFEAVGKAKNAVVVVGGYTGQEQVSERYATLTLFVPSDRLDSVLTQVGGAGKVRSQSQTAQDVTEQVVDVDSRIQTQRASLNRVRLLLDRATGISEIVQLESEVTRREADLESLLKRQQALAGSVAMSTVTVRISQDGAPAPVREEDDDSFLGALAVGWNAFLDAGGFVLRVVGTVLPFAVVLAVPAYLWWRSRRRARPKPAEIPA
ncbi:DUF4349 domain-containing protein [Actinokineospora sp. NBRC 105648]|uniref:DUF4349 domain-containing protein n=1 Tax=Actinokineospora sp. NBRC 105648 TaxID=3032206 RepID=UPI0024A13148|nr:DUF4349 domain-containing protein [Actinokineospora sp. NBRC 105648]GLZ38238.1 lipoprotein [Actinokineospora sp. NBRC 105648]